MSDKQAKSPKYRVIVETTGRYDSGFMELASIEDSQLAIEILQFIAQKQAERENEGPILEEK